MTEPSNILDINNEEHSKLIHDILSKIIGNTNKTRFDRINKCSEVLGAINNRELLFNISLNGDITLYSVD